ncbi:MAG TPA: ABC transporter permease [Pseudonocardiaceae bacterium]|nr:ABC transporter permease [Pseudonocardiaceae bacterium]
MVYAALVIAAKDLRQRFRDRSAIVLGFIAPLAIAALMSLAFQSSQGYHTDVAVVDADGGELAAAFVAMLRSPELAQFVTVRPADGLDDARRRVESGELGAAFVIPPGFTAAAHGAGDAAPVTVLGHTDEPLAEQVGKAIADSFAAQLNAVRLSAAAAVAAGAPPAELPQLAARAAQRRLPVELAAQPAGAKPLSAISYYGPAMGIFFAMFAIGFTARGFYQERDGGTLDRIWAAPVPRGAVLAGKSLATFGYALASLTTMAVVTTLVFDADWGPPLAAAALLVAMTIALVSLTALVVAAARTERQAEAVASILTFGLVLLGGNFVFISAAPPLLRRLALLTPNGWALRGFTDLATGGSGLAIVAVPVLAMLAFAAVCGVLAALLARRTLMPR